MPASANNLSSQLFNGNELLLRAGPVIFASIRNGRWSNPDTWDEAREPSPLDSVLVRHTVHAGWRRDGIDGLTANGQIPESFPDQLAASITIINPASDPEVTGTFPSLLFGNNSANADATSPAGDLWATPAGVGIVNNNPATTQPSGDPDVFDINATATGGTLYNGLIFYSTSRSSQFEFIRNDGQIWNGAKVIVGRR